MPELDPAAVIEAVTRDRRLRAFTGHGRIETLPARQARRHLLLDKIAQAFEPGVRYSERQVNLFLGTLHADYAALRRYLVDEEFLSAPMASTGAAAVLCSRPRPVAVASSHARYQGQRRCHGRVPDAAGSPRAPSRSRGPQS